MSAGAIIAIVVILVVIAAVAAWMAMRRSSERRSLGPEYSRLVDEVGARRANAEYDKRRRRVDGLGLKPLTDERRTLYGNQWVAAQETFIDNPAEAVRTAGALVTAVAADRGYEVADSRQFLTDLSVYHGAQLDGYRNAIELTNRSAGNTATEHYRQALLDYRAMFDALGEFPGKAEATPVAVTADTTGGGVAPAAATADAAEPPTAVTPALDPTTAAVPAQVATDRAAAEQAGPDPVASDRVAADEAAADQADAGHRVFWRRDRHETGSNRP